MWIRFHNVVTCKLEDIYVRVTHFSSQIIIDGNMVIGIDIDNEGILTVRWYK